MYERGEYTPMSREDYIACVCDSIELLPEDTVIARLTGDGAPDTLLAPMWSKKKVTVINDIDKELFRRNSYQGINFSR
jgi:radical SAM superfamily enzyme